MVFCCIAIVAIALMYWTALTIRQLLVSPRRDKASPLPAPPRALTGNGAQPVFGHTWLFKRLGGDIGTQFPPEWHEWNCVPKSWSRPLGDCFSIFIWGQWRVIIRGSERARKVLGQGELKEDWAWSAPTTLLGSRCIPLMEDEAGAFLYQMLARPLSAGNVIQFAPEFAEIAKQFLDDLASGKLSKPKPSRRNSINLSDDEPVSGSSFAYDKAEPELMEEGRISPSEDESEENPLHHKIKYGTLRSYTFDLIDGPILRTEKWSSVGLNQHGETNVDFESETQDENTKENSTWASRNLMLLWMERIKRAMCVIKLTFGTEWMHIWILNEYGRAVNGRMHIAKVLSQHIQKVGSCLPIERKPGHILRDPFVTPFPIVSMAENYLFSGETVTGMTHRRSSQLQGRKRTFSEPYAFSDFQSEQFIESEQFTVAETAPSSQDTLRPLIHKRCVSHSVAVNGQPDMVATTDYSPRRARANTCPGLLMTPPATENRNKVDNNLPEQGESGDMKPKRSILDSILRRVDEEGNGLTCAAATETSILLWMMLDAGNAWTAMALNLLALDKSACLRVQRELDELVSLYGSESLYEPAVLSKMKVLDALLYEAIRLCPPFLGGMKKTTATVELEDLGVQIPKNTHVIFCQSTEDSFDLSRAIGKNPMDLGRSYPCIELLGFLPFKGLEVPLMVLQSKTFIAVLLQKYSPFLSKKRTFFRKLRSAIKKGESASIPANSSSPEISSIYAESSRSYQFADESEVTKDLDDTTQSEAMKLFHKVPFPEPRRVLNITERDSALQILGIDGLGHK